MTIVRFENQAAQGDMLITRIDEIPADAVPVAPQNGVYILAHSETGHHHVIDARHTRMLNDPSDPMTSYLEVLSVDTAMFQHQRAFDTHKTLQPSRPGKFKIRRQREAAFEGWRKAQD